MGGLPIGQDVLLAVITSMLGSGAFGALVTVWAGRRQRQEAVVPP